MARARSVRAHAGVSLGAWVEATCAVAVLLAASLASFGTALAQTATTSPPGIIGTQTARPPSSFPSQPGGPFGPTPTIDKSLPLYLQGDELIYDTRNNRVISRGNVELYYNNYVLTADEVIYDQSANTLTARGNAQLRDPNGNITRGDSIETTADFRDAFIQSLSVISKDDTRIAARRAVRKDGNVTEFEQGRFTPCKNDPGKPPLWCVSAQRIVHDQQAATISYQDAQFELFGVPVFYLPYFQHPDPSVKRQSGFLMPEFSNSSTLGFGFSLPYYFALAPNADFTLESKYWSKQGILYQGEFRHKVAIGDVTGEYYVRLAGIDQNGNNLPDGTPAATRAQLDGWRGSVQTRGVFSLASWWKFGWDVTLESDDSFRRFYQLDNILQTDRINTIWLQGLSERNHFGMQLYQFGGLIATNSAFSDQRVLPVIDWNYIVGHPVLGGELSFNLNAQAVQHTDGTDSERVSINAQWRRKLVDDFGQVWTPFTYVVADVTSFTNGFNPDNGAPIGSDTIARAIGAVGFTYAYPFVAHTSIGSHVIEPVVQVIARPNDVNQRVIPNEDAKSLVWDDTLLFDKDKFSGWDRVETGTRANVGLQYTFQANNGGYARFVAGQSIQIAGTNPYANPGLSPEYMIDANGILTFRDANGAPILAPSFSSTSGLNTNYSDYVVGAYIAPVQYFRLVSQSRFDEASLGLKRENIYSSLTLGPLSLQGQYTYARDETALGVVTSQQEVLGGIGLKLTDRWTANALARYDIDNAIWLQDQFQLKYSDECFVLAATYTETRITNAALGIQPDRTIMLRFELKYLGQYGYSSSKVDTLFGVNQPPAK